ncbi:MAG TPA: PQQ-binding-like beta-propeller repeat protein, partial [Pirellulales bacterium]|nr:PQQ-binding-like beta-propeller repeat protein [Pirellulales bacterium]
AAGRFRQALAHYRAAAREAADGAGGSLAARVRLAAAMLGRDLGSPPEESLEFDGQQLSPAEFEQLAAEMRSRAPAARSDCVEPLAPPPGNYTARVAARFDGGGPPAPEVTRPVRLARAANSVIVSSGYSVAAFDPADGNRRWLFSLAEAGKAPAWSAEPMSPLVIGSAVYVRQIGAGGPELVGLSVDTGQPLWKDRSVPRAVCDPLLIDDRFVVCLVHDDVAGRRRVDLATLDIATGRVIERLRLAWLSGDAPSTRCTLTVVEDSLVFATSDVVIAADLRGRPRWARRIDARDRPPTGANSSELPWIGPGADCVFCYQPVEGLLQSIDLSTGREHWRRVIGPARRVMAVGTERLAVRTDDGVDLYDANSGETRWHFTAAAQAVVAAASAAQPALLLVEAIPTEVPRLRWLDLTSGQPNGESVLAGLSPGPASLTPCSMGGAGFWLARRDPAAKTVELIELRAK